MSGAENNPMRNWRSSSPRRAAADNLDHKAARVEGAHERADRPRCVVSLLLAVLHTVLSYVQAQRVPVALPV